MYRDPIAFQLRTLNILLKKSIDKVVNPNNDKATWMHTVILGFLQDNEEQGKDVFQKDIETEFVMNRSTTSEMLSLMEKNGLIKRVSVDYDARLKKIVLTDTSHDINKYIDKQFRKIHEQLIQNISPEQLELFDKTCEQMIENLKGE